MADNILSRIAAFPAAVAQKQELNAVVNDITALATEKAKIGLAGPLAGTLLAIKDNLNLLGTTTTCASRILDGYTSPYTATAVERLMDAGASIVGKTNMDEFAMGSSTEYSCYGVTRHPIDPELVPGGSSGGSAVAVATDLVDAALGSDTGGSVRQPAAFCGIYGLKPTYGRVSRYGLVAFASSFDQIGVFSKSTELAANVFEAMAGHDKCDSTTANEPVNTFEYDEDRARKMVVGIPKEYQHNGVEPQIHDRLASVMSFLKGEGVKFKELSLPHTEYAVPTYYVLTTAEASSNLARFDGVRYGSRYGAANDLDSLYEETRSRGFGAEVQRRIMLGTYVLSAGYADRYYIRAQQVRRLIQRDFKEAFGDVDLLLCPTTPTFPFPIGSKVDDPLTMYLSDVFTTPMSLAGVPAMSIPVGFGNNGLPIGLQLTADYFGEDAIFQLSRLIEEKYTG